MNHSLNSRESQAVANAVATLMALASHSLSPAQTKMATRSAGHLLWVMNIDQYEAHGMTFKAIPPEGEVIDAQPLDRLLSFEGAPQPD